MYVSVCVRVCVWSITTNKSASINQYQHSKLFNNRKNIKSLCIKNVVLWCVFTNTGVLRSGGGRTRDIPIVVAINVG